MRSRVRASEKVFWQCDCLCLSRTRGPVITGWLRTNLGVGASSIPNSQRDRSPETAMFRITVIDNPAEEKWILQGHLTGEFASELNANWQMSLARCSERPRIVDLSDVTLIDKNG